MSGADPGAGAGEVGRRGTRAVWLAGLVVAVGAAVLTAHGLIEVALGSGVPKVIGWLYPVITDGLALVAYATTTRLHGPGRAYAWVVVVAAAGLSALAQAAYLAGGAPEAPAGLRFVVGACPPVAAAIAAHLLFLIGTSTHPGAASHPGRVDTAGSTPRATSAADSDESTEPNPAGVGVQPRSVQLSIGPGVQGVQPSVSNAVQPSVSNTLPGLGREPRPRVLSPIDRARTSASAHLSESGHLPSARQLAALAGVGRGTAHTAIQQLAAGSIALHLVTEHTPDEAHNTKKGHDS